MSLLFCGRCHHAEDVHPGHGPCRFHLCECPRFDGSRHVPVPPHPEPRHGR
jgi:hypothetical protein